jgi:hypothetical protein
MKVLDSYFVFNKGDMKMNKIVKKIGMVFAAVLMSAVLIVPAYAATGRKINRVNLKITSKIEPGSRFGEEEIDIETSGGAKYSVDYYEIDNEGFEWEDDMIPELTIYLASDDKYGFNLKTASSVSLTGATYVKASRADYESGSGYRTLKLVVKLPSMEEQIGNMTEVTLTDGGYAYWDEVTGAGDYQLRFYRNGTAIGATETLTTDTLYNLQTVMNRAGNYMVKVRARNKVNSDNKSDWIESNTVSLTTEQANRVREGVAPQRPVRGEWRMDDTGWWYQFDDGTYVQNNWQMIGDRWYFFDENGYMKTGWINWEGKDYYCKEGSGEMLTNTTTPDGYILGSDGTKANSR